MAITNVLTQVRNGMAVVAADGVHIGNVKAIWYGTDPTEAAPRCDEEVCSRLEVHSGFFGRHALYVPYNALAAIAGQRVTLTLASTQIAETNWSQKPHWIRQETPPGDVTLHGGSI